MAGGRARLEISETQEAGLAQFRGLAGWLAGMALAAHDEGLGPPLHLELVGLRGVDEGHPDVLDGRDDRLVAHRALDVAVGAADRPRLRGSGGCVKGGAGRASSSAACQQKRERKPRTPKPMQLTSGPPRKSARVGMPLPALLSAVMGWIWVFSA